MNKPTSERLKELRTDSDLFQNDLAALLKRSRASISNYENGRAIDQDVIIAYCQYFHVSADWLLGLTTDRTPGGSKLTNKLHTINTLAQQRGYMPVDISQLDMLLDAITDYYRSGAPAGDTPTVMFSAILSAVFDLYFRLPSGTVADVLNASNAVSVAGLGSHDVLTAYLARLDATKN